VAIEDVWGWSVNSRQIVRAPDLSGIDTATTPWLLSFRDWMTAHATRSGRRVINATGAGMLFGGGIEHGRLSDVLTRQVAVPSIPALARRLPHVRPSVVAGRLRVLRETLTSSGPAAVARNSRSMSVATISSRCDRGSPRPTAHMASEYGSAPIEQA
jgi:hypothetical protein